MNDELAPVIMSYVAAVGSASDGHWQGRSATFWLSLGLDRENAAHVGIVRETFRTHGIVVSTSSGELGCEPPDAWIVLTSIPDAGDDASRIDDLPDALFDDAPVPVDVLPDVAGIETSAVESPSTYLSPSLAPSPADGLNPPATASVAPATPWMWSDGSSDSAAWVRCPSCGATVLSTALFCPICDLPQTHIREQARQPVAIMGEAYPVLPEGYRAKGWPPPPTRRQRLHVPPEASVIIGILVLGLGARLGDMVMPLLVFGAMVVLGVSVWKPEVLETVLGRGRSRHGLRFADGTLAQIAIVVVVIIAMYLLSPGTAMFGLSGGRVVP